MKNKWKYLLILPLIILLITGCSKVTEEEYGKIMAEHPVRVGKTVNHAEDSILDMYLVLPDSYREENAETFKYNMSVYVDEIKKLKGSEPDGFADFHELYLKSMLNFQKSIDLYAKAVKKDSYSLSTSDFEEISKYYSLGQEFMGMALDELSYIK